LKRFSFRLQKILDLKKIREQEAQRELGKTLRDLNQKDDQLNTSKGVKASFDARFHELNRKGIIDTLFFRRYQGYQLVLQKDIQQLQTELTKQEEVVDEARYKFQQAKRHTETLEKLEQRALSSYWTEVNKEEQNWMSEVALGRFRRRRESGNVALMLMVIGSIAFALSLLTIGLLFATGSLDGHRAAMILQVMRYDLSDMAIYEHQAKEYKEDLTEKDQLQAYLIKGDERPHFIIKSDFDRMKMKADEYDKILANDVDEDVVITQEVHNHRRALLHRYERSIGAMHKAMMAAQKEAETKLSEVETVKKQVALERESMSMAKERAEDAKKEKGMEELLQSFNSMDPEDIIKVLTAGKEPVDFLNPKDPQPSTAEQVAEKVSEYMVKMSARKRAGVLQALSPEWAKLVLPLLEGSESTL